MLVPRKRFCGGWVFQSASSLVLCRVADTLSIRALSLSLSLCLSLLPTSVHAAAGASKPKPPASERASQRAHLSGGAFFSILTKTGEWCQSYKPFVSKPVFLPVLQSTAGACLFFLFFFVWPVLPQLPAAPPRDTTAAARHAEICIHPQRWSLYLRFFSAVCRSLPVAPFEYALLSWLYSPSVLHCLFLSN